jgi:hypothetical protein
MGVDVESKADRYLRSSHDQLKDAVKITDGSACHILQRALRTAAALTERGEADVEDLVYCGT